MSDADGPALGEAFGVWGLYALVALAITVTYARLPVSELYNVGDGGLRGGLGRAVVFLNFPTALAALAVIGVVVDRARARAASVLGLVAAGLCAVAVVPGVVEQSDLDAKPVNAIPALGVALALGLTLWTLRARGMGQVPRRVRGDRIRLVLAVVLPLAAIPWIAAELGFYSDLGGLFYTSAIVPEEGHPGIHAVHLGHHHGLDGTLLALTALALTRELGRMRRPRLRIALTAYLALMLVYGLANATQDYWTEQLWKRDWTSIKLPSVTVPHASLAWLGILLASGAVYAVLRRA